jgi:hypothetical protein
MKKFMEGITDRLSKKQIIHISVIVVSLFLALVLQIISSHLKKNLDTQQMAQRWDNSGK